MSTQAITIAAGGNAGAQLRLLGNLIQKAATPLGDTNGSGASVVLTIDNGPTGGVASVVVSGGGLPTQPTYIV
jgi:hypothetical protein